MITWQMWQNAGEPVMAEAMLEYERRQSSLGFRPPLPIDKEAAERRPINERGYKILHCLKKRGPMTANEIEAKLKIGMHKTANNLHQLVKHGKVSRSGKSALNRRVIYEAVEND
jgi:predicted HTH transcriptional regulator